MQAEVLILHENLQLEHLINEASLNNGPNDGYVSPTGNISTGCCIGKKSMC